MKFSTFATFSDSLKNKKIGVLVTIVLTLLILKSFTGPLLFHPNKYSFDPHGMDGSVTYYYSIYQLKNDSTYLKQSACNYPYGESIFFSGNLPIATVFLKFINNHLFKVEDLIPGIFNMMMLLSLPIGAMFLFLIFHRFKVPFLFSIGCSIAIVFLSPQYPRMLGHFSLSYAFAFPCMLYLLIRFAETPKTSISLLICIYVFLMAMLHIYYLALFGVLILIFHFMFLLKNKWKFSSLVGFLKNLFIQIFLPYFILNFIIFLSSNVTDRTSHPWGFFLTLSSLDGIFYPFDRSYEPPLRKYYEFHQTSGEGRAFVGLFAIFSILVFVLYRLWLLFRGRFKSALSYSPTFFFNFLLISALAGAIYSTGYPYNDNPQLLEKIGTLRQIRSVGRFAWLTFFGLNLCSVFFIGTFIQKINNHFYRLLASLPLLFLFLFDSFQFPSHLKDSFLHENFYDNKINKLKYPSLSKIDPRKYQAIIPLPYFQNGSDQIHFMPEGGAVIIHTYIATLLTKLPSLSAFLSRSSISQANNQLELFLEPYNKLQILKDFPNKKPFLLLVREKDVPESQKLLLNKAQFLMHDTEFNLYELNFQTLETLTDSLYEKNLKEMPHNFAPEDIAALQKNIVQVNFDSLLTTQAYRGKGAYCGQIKNYNRLLKCKIPNPIAGKEYKISFWMADFKKELYPRSIIELIQVDTAGKNVSGFWESPLGAIKALDGDWALLEIPFTLINKKYELQVTMWNKEIYDDAPLVIDEILLRPADQDVFKVIPRALMKNNRLYRLKD